jgi:hypothetical protein
MLIATEPPGLAVVRADSDDLKQQIFEFRYRIYVKLMNRRQVHADHKRRIIVEPLDERGINYAAVRNGEIVGTLRRNTFDDPVVHYYVKLYRTF